MEKLVNALLASGASEAFREPVDWRGLGLTDYPSVIKRPMDLGTVKLRLEQGAYCSAEACAADVRLIWDNCRTYNGGGVPVKLHKAADALSKRFEARFAKLPASALLKMSRDAGGGGGACHGGNGKGPGGNKRANGAKSGVDMTAPTDEERRRLAWHLGRARMEDVTESVHEIDRRCPGALVLQGESIEVDVDALDTWTFCAVERVVAPIAAHRRASRTTARRGRKKRQTSSGRGGPQGGAGGRSGGGGGGGAGGRAGGAGEGSGADEVVTVVARVGRPCKKAKVEACSSL